MTVIEQVGAWSGTQLFVFGGQESSPASVMSTDAGVLLSNEAALWTPDG